MTLKPKQVVSAQRGSRAAAAPKKRAAQPAAWISRARAAAFEILTLAGEGKGHSDDLLHSSRTAALSPADRNLATALVMGTLRWQIALDAAIAKLLARPDQPPAEPVALALRMGAFQLLHMDRIPAHAALNESVELCRAAGHPHAAGMVNAILRKLVAQANPGTRGAQETRRSVPIFESPAAFAERLSHPLWLVERWIAAYGREAALAICEYGQQEPQAGGLFALNALAATTVAADEAASLPGDPASLGGDSASTNPAALQIAPQIDDGSRLVAELAAAALPAVGDRAPRVWDCCAAPGGKTLVIAERLPGAEILASDVSARRLAGMQQRLRIFPVAERTVCRVADAAKAATDEALRESFFDLILCDAPCSGTGTLARNPEIRHRLRLADLARHAERQQAILAGTLGRLAPGGRLLYSTCSLEAEENEQVVETVLWKAPGVRRVSLEPALAAVAAAGILPAEAAATLARTAVRGDALRTIPSIQPCDGFFAALLERK